MEYCKGNKRIEISIIEEMVTPKKTVKTQFGEIPIEVPRDRKGDFEPIIVPKISVISLYSSGMSTRGYT